MELVTRTTKERKIVVSPTFGEKRPCIEPGCITRLNRYHRGERCYVHEAKARFRPITSVDELDRLMVEAKS